MPLSHSKACQQDVALDMPLRQFILGSAGILLRASAYDFQSHAEEIGPGESAPGALPTELAAEEAAVRSHAEGLSTAEVILGGSRFPGSFW